MFAEIVTTITTKINLDTFQPDHSVKIASEDDLPHDVIYAAVRGACNATLNSLPARTKDVEVEVDE